MGTTSAVSNLAVKPALSRGRPERTESAGRKGVRMPESHSFPSGHTASAFAFSSAVGGELPALATPLRLMATTVAYSRVHTGVHYPGDVVIGALIGAGIGTATRLVARRAGRQWEMTIFSTHHRDPEQPGQRRHAEQPATRTVPRPRRRSGRGTAAAEPSRPAPRSSRP